MMNEHQFKIQKAIVRLLVHIESKNTNKYFEYDEDIKILREYKEGLDRQRTNND